MTIFLDLAKSYILEALKIERTRARNMNIFFPRLRDTTLSGTKRNLAKDTLNSIIALKEQNDDKANLDTLKKMLHKCNDEAATNAGEEGYTPGQFAIAMQKIFSLLERIDHHFDKQELFNIRPSVDFLAYNALTYKNFNPTTTYRDPLDIFLYYAVKYYVTKDKQVMEMTTTTWLISKIPYVSDVKVGIEKQQQLSKSIKALRSILMPVNNPETRKTIVLNAIRIILDGGSMYNAFLMNSDPTVPFPVWKKTTSGELKIMMEQAYFEINNMTLFNQTFSSNNNNNNNSTAINPKPVPQIYQSDDFGSFLFFLPDEQTNDSSSQNKEDYLEKLEYDFH